MIGSLQILEAALIAITACVYVLILMRPGELFSGWFKLLYTLFRIDDRQRNGLTDPWYFKVLVGCEKCISGQMAFWIFLIHNWQFYKAGVWELVIPHFLFAGLTIFCATVTAKFLNKYIL